MKGWAAVMALLVLGVILAADFGVLHIARRIHEVPFGDKLGHFMLFGILNLLVILAVRDSRPEIAGWRLAAVCSALLSGCAVIEELSQRCIGGRTFSYGDMLANIAGILFFGAMALGLIVRARSRAGRDLTDRRA
jgi:VanZ family protein